MVVGIAKGHLEVSHRPGALTLAAWNHGRPLTQAHPGKAVPREWEEGLVLTAARAAGEAPWTPPDIWRGQHDRLRRPPLHGHPAPGRLLMPVRTRGQVPAGEAAIEVAADRARSQPAQR